MSYTISAKASYPSQTHRQWSRAIQQETRQLLLAKRPVNLPKNLSKTDIYFKNMRGEIAVMTLSDYMACVWRLSVMPHGRVRQYDDVELLLADEWVLR